VTSTVDHQSKYYHLRQNLPPLPTKPHNVTLTQCRVIFSIKRFFLRSENMFDKTLAKNKQQMSCETQWNCFV